MEKKLVYEAVCSDINQKIEGVKNALLNHKEGLNSESKSSAGDKHNTSRAMMHLEEEKLSKQLSQYLLLKKVLFSINPEGSAQEITLGSLVNTNRGWVFLSVALGQLKVNAENVMVISLASPIGAAMKGLKAGSSFVFNQINWEIYSVC